jgi:hypothetical protein
MDESNEMRVADRLDRYPAIADNALRFRGPGRVKKFGAAVRAG